MRISRRSLKSSLTQLGKAPAPDADPAFVDRLEAQLMTDGATPPLPADNVIPFRSRAHRAFVIGVAAATLTGAAAAAALVMGTGNDSHRLITATEPTATSTATSTATTNTVEPTSTTSTPLNTTTTTLPTSTTLASGVTTTIPAGPTPTTVSNVVPPVTVPDTTTTTLTVGSTSTTEVHVPATLGINCVVDGSHITCIWTPGPGGTDHYLVLRSRPGGTDGRVLTPLPGQLTYTDTQIVSGDSFNYLVHAFDATGKSVAHSTAVLVTVP